MIHVDDANTMAFPNLCKRIIFLYTIYIVFSVEITRVQRFPFIVRRARYSCLDMLQLLVAFSSQERCLLKRQHGYVPLRKSMNKTLGTRKTTSHNENLCRKESPNLFFFVFCVLQVCAFY